ncbi:MAG: GreA/GreB family elongation factor [Elusimicrobia bacterium]|nr:GreA/GreB family elongation factor [Elusimicrobiota bacterium]
MSRAFVKEDADGPEPERHIPSGPNYVTPRGLALIKAELAKELPPRDRRYWQTRLLSAVLVDAAKQPPPDVRFGAAVRLDGPGGSARTLRIVGQDEAEEGGELVAWDSVPALALLGKKPGERVTLAEGEPELTVTSVEYR